MNKRKKLISLIVTAALFANLAIFGVAQAVNDTTEAQFTVNSGALSINIPSNTINMGSGAANTTTITANDVSLGDWELADRRGTSNAFTVSVTTTAPTISGGANFAYTNTHIKATALTMTNSSSNTGIAITSSPDASNYLAFSGSGGTSNSISLVTADNRIHIVTFTVRPLLKWVIPAFQGPGRYDATITGTIV